MKGGASALTGAPHVLERMPGVMNAASEPDAAGASITISGITKVFGRVNAVDGVSIDVAPGEFLSLLGPSGSGKTTLLMMIAGFETPSAGTIRLGERDITYLAPNERQIGMVFQKYALFPHMTVARNIAFPLKMRKRPKAEIAAKVEAALAMVRLDDYGGRFPHQLSGGQQQRIAVARALVFEPPVLLMDEPLGALDKKLREQLQIEIKRLQKRLGVTVIYVTHDQEEALTMSDRVAVMNKGRLEQVGTPADLYARPDNPFVADFIGKMNFLDGRVAECDAACVVVTLDGCARMQTSAGQGGWTAGDRVRVAIRPEALRFAEENANESIPGIVETTIFVGSFHVALIRLAGGALVQMQSPATSGLVLLKEGEAVRLTCAPEALHLFRAGAA
jgi:mannopine transport system ATP-binding protein